MKRALITLVAIVSLLGSAPEVYSVGALFVRPLRSTAELSLLSIKTYDAQVWINDHIATTHVVQKFMNESSDQVEATFIFPLPETAVITDMYYWFNGKRYRADVRERKEAQAAYDSKVRRVLDPALLQEIGDNVFKIQIAPINARSEVTFEITYTEILPFDRGTGHYTHLLRSVGLSPKPLERLSIKITAVTQRTWKLIEAPSYASSPANSIVAITPSESLITYGDENVHPTKNYELRLTSNRDGVEMGTLTYVPVPADSFGTDPFFVSWIIPPSEDAKDVRRSIVVTADVSSSMEGKRIVQLRTALHAFLNGLNPDDRFNLVTFSTGVAKFRADLVEASADNIAEAHEFVRKLSALGLTNFNDALRAGLQQSYDSLTARVNVFLTDGEPSWGETREAVLIDSVNRWNTYGARIYPMAIGVDFNVSILKKLAVTTGGFVTLVADDDSIAIVVNDNLQRISTPNITDLRLSYGGLPTLDVYPAVLPDVPAGGRVTQYGRYSTGGPYEVTLRGVLQASAFELKQVVHFGDSARNNKAVARLWAKAKIDALLSEISRVGELKELVNAVIDLSIRFNILTKYTALYADPDDPSTTSVPHEERPVEGMKLSVSPNPSYDHLNFTITLPDLAGAETANAEIIILDVRGLRVATLSVAVHAGSITIPWNMLTSSGVPLVPGVYTAMLRIGASRMAMPFVVQ
jgi:Ca-activated chloride channel family protein